MKRLLWMGVGMALTLVLLALVTGVAFLGTRASPSRVAEQEMADELAAPPPSAAATAERGGAVGGLKRRPKMEAKKKVAADREDRPSRPGAPPPSPEPAEEEKASAEGGAAAAAPTRAWFPETFLFEPLVVTDAQGAASVEVRVPDRLTTWRVLALAHSREGAQAGATAQFLGTLPTYVEPVTPDFLVAGDEVRLPIQVVNTTEQSVTAPLEVRVNGQSALSTRLTLGAQESRVTYATVRAAAPGVLKLQSALGTADATARTVRVVSSGRPVELHSGGTLAAPRSFSLASPEGLMADGTVHVAVFPGALAVLRSELGIAVGRSSVSDDAYALLLAGTGAGLLRALGEQEDPKAIRTLSVLSMQRVLAHARAPEPGVAGLLLEAAAMHPDTPALSRLAERLSAQLAGAQRPDGTFQGGDGWALGRLLVATADGVRAVRAVRGPGAATRAQRVSVLASGAFERFAAQVKDGYTAAAILSSGVVDGPVAEVLRAQVKEAVTARPNGARVLVPDRAAQRADGSAPSEAEATALAALALTEGDPLRAELGASVLGGYRPESGWGDGLANLACLRTVLALFKDPLPPEVKVRLEVDGKAVAQGTLLAAKAMEPLRLEAPAPAPGEHAYRLIAEPAVPGLGFSLTLVGHVPWRREPSEGLELVISPPAKLKVGASAVVALVASAPAGVAVEIRQALPAGVQPVQSSLDALVSSQLVTRYAVEEGAVTLYLPPRPSASPFQASYLVVPTLGGTLHSGASRIRAVGGAVDSEFHVPPVAWAVR